MMESNNNNSDQPQVSGEIPVANIALGYANDPLKRHRRVFYIARTYGTMMLCWVTMIACVAAYVLPTIILPLSSKADPVTLQKYYESPLAISLIACVLLFSILSFVLSAIVLFMLKLEPIKTILCILSFFLMPCLAPSVFITMLASISFFEENKVKTSGGFISAKELKRLKILAGKE